MTERSVSSSSVSPVAGGRSGNGREAIFAAALENFFLRGYHGTSIRDIAQSAGMTAPSLYHHFASKQDILRTVMQSIMQDALATVREALLRAGPTAAGQLHAMMQAWVGFHATRQKEARVGASELDALDSVGRQVVVALRDELEQMFRSVVVRGIENGEFRTPNPREAARGIVGMGVAVAGWYRPGGSMSAGQIADVYARLALAVVEATEASAADASAASTDAAVGTVAPPRRRRQPRTTQRAG